MYGLYKPPVVVPLRNRQQRGDDKLSPNEQLIKSAFFLSIHLAKEAFLMNLLPQQEEVCPG